MPRCRALFGVGAQRVEPLPIAGPEAVGTLLAPGPGGGLEEVAAVLAPTFAVDRSLIPWIALRGALVELSRTVLDRRTAHTDPADLGRAMHIDLADGDPAVLSSGIEGLGVEQRGRALAVARATLLRAEDDAVLRSAAVEQIRAGPHMLPEALAVDVIGWCAVALARLGLVGAVVEDVGPPTPLDGAGWYPDPVGDPVERFHDGRDWTARCRTTTERRPRELVVALV